jgi:hypothetical protein
MILQKIITHNTYKKYLNIKYFIFLYYFIFFNFINDAVMLFINTYVYTYIKAI